MRNLNDYCWIRKKERSKELQTRKADRNKADEKEIWKQIDC